MTCWWPCCAKKTPADVIRCPLGGGVDWGRLGGGTTTMEMYLRSDDSIANVGVVSSVSSQRSLHQFDNAGTHQFSWNVPFDTGTTPATDTPIVATGSGSDYYVVGGHTITKWSESGVEWMRSLYDETEDVYWPRRASNSPMAPHDIEVFGSRLVVLFYDGSSTPGDPPYTGRVYNTSDGSAITDPATNAPLIRANSVHKGPSGEMYLTRRGVLNLTGQWATDPGSLVEKYSTVGGSLLGDWAATDNDEVPGFSTVNHQRANTAMNVAVDGSGNVYVAGKMAVRSTGIIDTSTGLERMANSYMVKLDSNLNFVDALSIGDDINPGLYVATYGTSRVALSIAISVNFASYYDGVDLFTRFAGNMPLVYDTSLNQITWSFSPSNTVNCLRYDSTGGLVINLGTEKEYPQPDDTSDGVFYDVE